MIYNFSAGPGMIPKHVMLDAQLNFLNWNNTHVSVMEISHRSLDFYDIIQESKKNLRILLNIPNNYAILFCQGGARGQFSSIPLNLLSIYNTADYIDSGYWSYHAMIEAKKYCLPNHIIVRKIINNKHVILPMHTWLLSDQSDYLHFCPNETIEGIAIYEEPNFINKIVIGDFSSCILSRRINIKKYDLIYASSQKNIGPSGITIIIINKKLLNTNNNHVIPSILNYKTIFTNESMFNTPVTFSWYVSNLVFQWMKNVGGIKYFEKINYKKSQLLYSKIDESDFYINNIHKNNRSYMNVIFNLHDTRLNDIFLTQAIQNGLKFLNGHKVVGGFRASIYNAMSFNGVKVLVDFMRYFENKFG